MVINKTNHKKIHRRDILKLIGAGFTTSILNRILPRWRIGGHQEKSFTDDSNISRTQLHLYLN